MSNNDAHEAHNKGQKDGSQGKGYHNPAYDAASQIVKSGDETKEIGEAYFDGYKEGQSKKSSN